MFPSASPAVLYLPAGLCADLSPDSESARNSESSGCDDLYSLSKGLSKEMPCFLVGQCSGASAPFAFWFSLAGSQRSQVQGASAALASLVRSSGRFSMSLAKDQVQNAGPEHALGAAILRDVAHPGYNKTYRSCPPTAPPPWPTCRPALPGSGWM